MSNQERIRYEKDWNFYGSTTGTTESVAGRIADVLGISSADVHDVSKLTAELVSGYEVLLLGTSTWGDGELQDDWYDGVKVLKGMDLSDKLVGLFGCGDSSPIRILFVTEWESFMET